MNEQPKEVEEEGEKSRVPGAPGLDSETWEAGDPHLDSPSKDCVPQVSTLRPGIAQTVAPWAGGPPELRL